MTDAPADGPSASPDPEEAPPAPPVPASSAPAEPTARRDPRATAYRLGVAALALGVTACLGWIAVTRADRLGWASPDDSMFVQLCWNTLHGAPLRFSLEAWDGPADRSYYASHLNLLFVLYLPFFAVSPGAKVLFLLKPLLSALGAIPLYALARRRTGSEALAAAITCLFLFHPLVTYNGLRISSNYLTFPLLFLALERLDRGSLAASGTCFLLAVAGREEISLMVAAFLVPLAVLRPERRRFALGVTAAALGVVLLYAGVLKGQFGAGPDHMYRFRHLGESLPALAASPLLSPRAFWGHLFAPDALLLALLVVLPLGPAVLLAPRYLLAAAAPWVLVAVSSVATDRVLGPYLVPVVPFLFAGLVEALRRFDSTASPRTWRRAAIGVAALLTLASWTGTRGPLRAYEAMRRTSSSLQSLQILAAATPEHAQVVALAEAVPREASVSASATTLIHLACRRYLYPFPVRAQQVDVVLVDTLSPPRWPARTDAEHRALVDALLAEPGVVVKRAGRFALIDRRAVPGPRVGR